MLSLCFFCKRIEPLGFLRFQGTQAQARQGTACSAHLGARNKACTGIMITAMAAHGGFNKQLDGIEKKGMNSRWLKDPQVDSNWYIQVDFLCGISRTIFEAPRAWRACFFTKSMCREEVGGRVACTFQECKHQLEVKLSRFFCQDILHCFTLELAKLVITLS